MNKTKLLKSILIPTLGISTIGSIAAVCTSCGNVNVTSVSLNKPSTTLALGNTETLTATVLPETATDKSVTWRSSNPSVATVNSNGTITAKAIGTATITVKTNDGGKIATCEVTVTPIHVTSVSLNKTSIDLPDGKTETLTATVLPEDAADKSVTWTSSDTNVATVDSNGKITAVYEGTATITVKTHDGGKTDTCVVNVNNSPYVVITANEDSTLSLQNNGGNNPDLQYSTDRTNWTTYSTEITIGQGQNLYLKGNNPNGWSHEPYDTVGKYSSLLIRGDASIAGNVMGLLDNGAKSGDEGDITGIPCSSCFYNLFENSIGITSVSDGFLPARTLADHCYASMFHSCASLTTVPKLPARTLINECYRAMFAFCSSLSTAPDLPATELADNCYRYMFQDCTSLTTALTLPATNLITNCYYGMFYDCTSLITAPALPATTLADNCYSNMFYGCTSLTTAPDLPATNLANSCYINMFAGCSSLTTTPALPATTLADSCYRAMFAFCSSLSTAPELPARTLADHCYGNMFQFCTSLTTAPELPATTLTDSCYRAMFWNCSSLTTVPDLSATTLAISCYNFMFQGCTSLNSIKIGYTGNYDSNYFKNWVDGVASSGTFYYNGSDTLANFGFPSGWTKSPF